MDTGVILRILFLAGVAILLFLPTVWAIRDVAHGSFPSMKNKVIWFVVVTFLPPLGAFVYIAVGRPRESEIAEDLEVQEVKTEAGRKENRRQRTDDR